MITSVLHADRAFRTLLAVGVLLTSAVAVPSMDARAEEAATPRALTIASAAYDDLTATRVAALADGGAVIVGRAPGTGLIRPLVVERIDASGASVWREEFTDLSGDRQFTTTVLADGDRIVVGGTVRRRSDDGFVRILGHDGTVRSTTYFASTDHQRENVTSIALLPDGATVVVGRTAGELVTPRIAPKHTDGFIALVEPDGSVAWTQQRARRWGETGPVPTSFGSVVVAPDGRILVLAHATCGGDAWCAGMESELAFLVLDRAGTLADVVRVRYADLFPGADLARLGAGEAIPGPDGLIVAAYQGSNRDSLRVSGLTWDLAPAWAGPSVLGTDRGLFAGGPVIVLADGRIVVAPTAYYGASFDGANRGGPDGLLAVLSARGELLDVRQYGGPADEWANGLAVLADGRILVTGIAGQGLSDHGLEPTARPIGTRLIASLAQPAAAHVHTPGTPAPATTVSNDAEWGDPDAVAPAPSPGTPSAPTSVDGAGGLLSLVSSVRGTESGGGVTTLPGTEVTVTAGWSTGTPTRVLSVTRREADGTVAWNRTFDTVVHDTGTQPRIVAASVAGAPRIAVIASGRSGATSTSHLIVLDADGATLWVGVMPGAVGSGVALTDVLMAGDGNVIVVGSSAADAASGASGARPMIARYGPDGTLAWAVRADRDAPSVYGRVAVAPDGTLVVTEGDRRFCSVAEPCTPRADLHVVRIAPEDGAELARVSHDLGDLFGLAVPYRVDGSPYGYVSGVHPGPEGPVVTGLVMRSGRYCLVTAGLGWDLARAWAGPAVHCTGGAELELWGTMTVLADGRIVSAASSYYEVAVAGPSMGHIDVVLGVHDARGVLLDAVQYGGSFQDVPTGVVANASGDVIVATSSGAGVTSLGAPTSVTAVGEHTRLTLVGGVPTWRSDVALRAPAPVSDAVVGADGEARGLTAAPSIAAEPEPAVEPEPEVEPEPVAEPEPEPEPEPDPTPSAPTDVRVGLDRDRVGVWWSVPADDGGSRITRYRVEVVDSATGEPLATRTTRATQRSAVVAGIRGRDVDVRVAAENVHGTGAWSPVQQLRMRAPSAPTVARVDASVGGLLRLGLAPASDGTTAPTRIDVRVLDGAGAGARLLRGTACSGATLLECIVAYPLSSIPSDGTLWIDVRARSPLGWGEYGERVPVHVGNATPEAVTDVTVTAMTNGRIDVRWTKAPPAGVVPNVRQVVEVRRGSGADAPVIATCNVSPQLSRCLMLRLPRRVDLSVTVVTSNLFGAGERSAPVTVRTR